VWPKGILAAEAVQDAAGAGKIGEEFFLTARGFQTIDAREKERGGGC
jgi:hypothetical protein